MTPENTRALLAEADQILVDLASALPLEDVKAHLPAPSFLHARIGEAREKLADALSLPDTDNRDVRERLFDLIWECDNVEEIVDKLLAAFPVLSTDVDALRAELERVRGSADAWWNQYDKAEAARQEAEAALSRAAAPEPEWEYGLKLRGLIVRVGSQEAIRVHQSIWGGEIVRHPSGPWEPLPVGGGSDGS